MNEYEAVSIVETHFGLNLIKVTNGEYSSACPWCGGEDRCRLFLNGNPAKPRMWCRQCGKTFFLDSIDSVKFDKEELQKYIEQRREEEKKREKDALATIQRSLDHLSYYNNMGNHLEAVEYWNSEGMNPDTINHFKLGFCDVCPLAPYTPSYTIPVTYDGKLFNIRHRLVRPNGQGKYRPHMKGLPAMLFNADDLNADDNTCLLVEGEKKAMVVRQEVGMPTIGVMGDQGFRKGWESKFGFSYVYVIYDPGSEQQAAGVAGLFGKGGRVMTLPTKADDFFVHYGGTRDKFLQFMKWATVI